MKLCTDANCYHCGKAAETVELTIDPTQDVYLCLACLTAGLALLAPPPAPPADVQKLVEAVAQAREDMGYYEDPDEKLYKEARFRSLAAERALLAALRAPPPEAEALARALAPFAAMDRDGCDLDELVLQRGVASDMTIITSREFREANAALAAFRARYPAAKQGE